jgi:NAD(P)-dependent dehydrogenase (short-subunit alcohol dehydrogenase family)
MTNWLITGVSSGLGAEIAKAALAGGAEDIVCGTVRSEEAKARFEALAPRRAIGIIANVAAGSTGWSTMRASE